MMEIKLVLWYILVVISTCLQGASLESVSKGGKVLQRVKRLDPGISGGLIRVKRLEDPGSKSLERVKRGALFDESIQLTGKARSADDATYEDDDAGLRSTKSLFGSKAEDEAQMFKIMLDGEFNTDEVEESVEPVAKRFDRHFMKIKRNWAHTLKKKRQHRYTQKKKVVKQLQQKDAKEVAKIRKNLKLYRNNKN